MDFMDLREGKKILTCYQSVKHDEHERHKGLTESATRQSCRIEERKEKKELNDK